MSKHLWEIDHAYYCSHSNYFAPGNEQPYSRYRSLSEFLAEEADADIDYNLAFRWDWVEGEDYGLPEYNGDDNYRNGLLCIYFMCQRKGLYRWAEVEVCRADEPAVIEYLRPRFEYLQALWVPFVADSGREG